jgi:hypothetical protein
MPAAHASEHRSTRLSTIRKISLASLIAAAAAVGAVAAAQAAGPMQTSLTNYVGFVGPTLPIQMKHVQRAGANAIRLYIGWNAIAPDAETKPAGFDARNPADPQYNWAALDAQVREAKADGLDPILSIETAPTWAQDSRGWDNGTNSPDPTEFGAFGEALAKRYSGNFEGLPRVRYYEAWNEANHYRHLNPQYEPVQPQGIPGDAQVPPNAPFFSADIYRGMLNAFSDAVHGVNPDNLVIAGSLSPTHRPFRFTPAVAPLTWMRAFLCLDNQDHQKPGCNQQANFDVWAVNPYTSGSPEHHAMDPNDISIPDIPKMRKTLTAAERAGQVVSTHTVQLWATEWSWDTRPPDPGGVPIKLHARWVSEALYRMWTFGVSLAVWFQTRDDVPEPGQAFSDSFQSGLYFNGGDNFNNDKPKLSLEAFRFPFVAYRKGRNSVLVWGRTPFGRRGTVTIEQKGSGFKRLKRLKANGFGIFTARIRTSGKGDLRARLGRENSVPFSLKVPPDRPGNPFG